MSICEDLFVVGSFRKRDAVLFYLEICQNLTGGFLEFGAFFILGIEVGKLQAVLPFEEQVWIFDDSGDPLRSSNNLVHMDSAVTVFIQKFQGFVIEFKTGGRAGEDSPFLAV